jgi:hypothetical protein
MSIVMTSKTQLIDGHCSISVLGVGVTEAGLISHNTQAMKDLYELLLIIQVLIRTGKWQQIEQKICVVCTDNVPNNGDMILRFMGRIAKERQDKDMERFLEDNIVFLNSMVDRITSQREGSNGMVPRCEPTPMKALVLLDPDNNLPPSLSHQPGVVVRSTREQLETDMSLKLRISNGTHTAVAHSLALLRNLQTTVLSTEEPGKLFMKYLESLVCDQIIPVAAMSMSNDQEAQLVWDDWKARLLHPNFGLSNFFITQNGAFKGGIRWKDTVTELLKYQQKNPESKSPTISVSFAFAYAALLRWLTPLCLSSTNAKDEVFRGWLEQSNSPEGDGNGHEVANQVFHADSLSYDVHQGWYEFKCQLSVKGMGDENILLPEILYRCRGKQPAACTRAVRAYLVSEQGGGLSKMASTAGFCSLVGAIATLYSRLLAGDGLCCVLEQIRNLGFDAPCDLLVDGEATVSASTLSFFQSGELDDRRDVVA